MQSNILRPNHTSQFSPADLQKIIDYVSILITIDQQNKQKIKGVGHAK